MALTVNSFNSLPFEDRGAIIFTRDCFVNSVKYYGNTVGLHQIEDFYVQVFYDSETNEILEIEAFETRDKALDKFAVSINLEEL